jgi:hypothetical protein
MSYNPESTIARPLLALTTPSSASSNYGPRRRQRRARLLLLAACGTLVLLVGSSYLYFGPSAGLPIPDRLAPYYTHPMFTRPHPHTGARMTSIRTPVRRRAGGRRPLTGRTRLLPIRLPIPTHPTTLPPPKRARAPSYPPSPPPSPPRARATPSRRPGRLRKGSTRSSPSQRSAGVWWTGMHGCGATLRHFGAWNSLLLRSARRRQ